MGIRFKAKLLLLFTTVSSVFSLNQSVFLAAQGNVPALPPITTTTVRRVAFTLMHSAIFHHDFVGVRDMLARGDDVNVADRDGITPLYMAVSGYLNSVEHNHETEDLDLEIVNALLNDPRITPSLNFVSFSQGGNTALHLAVQHGNITIIRALLRAGASINVHDNRGFYPLDYALTLNEDIRREVMSTLLGVDEPWERLLDVYMQWEHRRRQMMEPYSINNPLHRAVYCDNMDMVNVLLTIPGIRDSIDELNFYNEAPLHTAIRHRNAEMVEALLRAGAARNCRSRGYATALISVQGELPIEYAERHIDDADVRGRIIDLLRRYGCQ